MLFNYLINNDLVFYSMFAGTVGLIGYKFASSYLNSFYVDKSIQTDAWEDYSERLSQIGSKSLTSIDTITPISKNISPVSTLQTSSDLGIKTITDGSSTVTTVLPIPSINIERIPNPDLTAKVFDTITISYDYIDRAHSLADMACGGFL